MLVIKVATEIVYDIHIVKLDVAHSQKLIVINFANSNVSFSFTVLLFVDSRMQMCLYRDCFKLGKLYSIASR